MEVITIPREMLYPIGRIDIDKHFIGCVASGDLYSEPCQLFRKDLLDLTPHSLQKLEAVW